MSVAAACTAHADRLELQVATSRLLAFLFPDDEPPLDPGRYRFLDRIVERRPSLRRSLLDDEGSAVGREWAQVLDEHGAHVSLLHGLAILHREAATRSTARGAPDEGYWTVATALLTLLFSTERFWGSFWSGWYWGAEDRDRDDLLDACLRSVLAVHRTLGQKAFAAGRFDEAGLHLRCLDACRSGPDALASMLERRGISCRLPIDGARLARAQEIARRLMDEWCGEVVHEAERAANDADALARLPEGVRQDYGAGIGHLQPLIDLGVPHVAVLRASLRWYNDWCYDLYVKRQLDEIRDVMAAARQVADLLAPLCTPVHGHLPENQALSTHYMIRGFTADGEQALAEYRQALIWNEANDNAEQLLRDQARNVLVEQLNTAVECAKDQEWDKAYQIVDRITARVGGGGASADEQRHIDDARGAVLFHHGCALAEEGELSAALQRLRAALDALPGHPVVLDVIRQIEPLAPEELNWRRLRRAREALDAERYPQAIDHASQVPPGSGLYPQARDLQGAAHFLRGMEHALAKRLEAAVADLREAHRLVTDPTSRATVASQLSMVLSAHAVELVTSSQTQEEKFVDAMVDVLQRLRRHPGVR